MVSYDSCGLALTAGSENTAAAYDRILTSLGHAKNPSTILEAAIEQDPDFVLGHLLSGYLAMVFTDRDFVEVARAGLHAAEERLAQGVSVTDRERLHMVALTAWQAGDLARASRALDAILIDHPKDILALHMGHTLDVFLGDGLNMAVRFASVLPAWKETDPFYGFVLGMYGFGLEESREYEQAEEFARQGGEIDPKVVWAHHGVAHALLMQGKNQDGSRYLDTYYDYWSKDNYFASHIAIHAILFKLELDELETTVSLYDDLVFNVDTPPIILTMVDASSALWRLYLENIDVGDRWNVLAQSWEQKAFQTHYAFNDMHAMLAFVAADNAAAADRLIADQESYLNDESNARETNHARTRDLGLPVCKALRSFGRGEYGRTIALLHPLLNSSYKLGGSHAQRDIIYRTTLEACIRSSNLSLAHHLLGQRMIELPDSSYNLGKRAQLDAFSR